jgi:hypothetical protein
MMIQGSNDIPTPKENLLRGDCPALPLRGTGRVSPAMAPSLYDYYMPTYKYTKTYD